MQFEDFDKKIKEAAEHHHPAYDENAWTKMETLLDQHLPVKKDDRRRFVFFLLFLFLIGSGAFLLFRSGKGESGTVAKEQPATKATKQAAEVATPNEMVPKSINAQTQPAPGDNDYVQPIDDKQPSSSVTQANPQSAGDNVARQDLVQKTLSTPGAMLKNNFRNTDLKKTTASRNNDHKTQNKLPLSSSIGNSSSMSGVPGNPTNIAGNTPVNKTTTLNVQSTANTHQDSAGKNITVVKQNQVDSQATATPVKQKDKKQGGRKIPFAINFTVGPDLSFVGLSELGSVKMKYGAGLSYGIKKFTIRSGFYVTSKVYSADGSYYHPFYPNLEKVDGNCKVYEIPVTVSYNFRQAKKYNLFAATGLSSYIMKKETYEYLTKDPGTGMTNAWSRSWDNKNKHYFSVLNLSAGYERKFSNTVSVIAEPYLQVPLTGIGNGKMRLNSGGILFTLSVKPFGRKK